MDYRLKNRLDQYYLVLNVGMSLFLENTHLGTSKYTGEGASYLQKTELEYYVYRTSL